MTTAPVFPPTRTRTAGVRCVLLRADSPRAWCGRDVEGEVVLTLAELVLSTPDTHACRACVRAVARHLQARAASPDAALTVGAADGAYYAYKSVFYFESTAVGTADLKVDYDYGRNPFKPSRVRRKLLAVRQKLQAYAVDLQDLTVARTRKGHHLRVWLTYASDLVEVASTTILDLQAQLGDDPVRQAFNAARVARAEPKWNVLWSEKQRNGLTVMRERPDPATTTRLRRALGLKVDVVGEGETKEKGSHG